MITIYVRDLSGNEYACQATITNEYELNGNRELSATILPSKVNRLFIDDLAEMWEITDFDGVAHKIVYAKKKGEGDLLSVEIKAVPLFFDTFDTERIYDEHNEHMTAMRCFTLIFEDSGYNFVLVDSFDALEWEGLGGGETRLEMFKRALNRYGAEFRISGNTIYLHKQVGRDTQFQYRHRLNASNIVQENDATAMWTYAKGYGDYEEGDEEGGGGWENANLIREYTSPLANIPQIGIRHAPPIKDGRISDKTTMDGALKELVDESLKISVTADIHDLRRQGYPLAQPELGDRVFLIDERIGLDEEVRVVDISITRNWRGEVIDLNLTFGSEGITKRYQSNLSTAIKNITEVMAGRKKIPYSVLDNAVLQATKALQSAQTELLFKNGILAIDPTNPNKVVLFNSAGVGVSNDGGATFRTAMTGDGMVADTITSGSLFTNNVSIVGESNYFYWDGNGLTAINPNDVRRYVELTSNGLYISRGALTIERPDGGMFVMNGIPNLNYSVQFCSPPFKSEGVVVQNQWFRTTSIDYLNLDMGTFRHEGRYLKVTIAHRMAAEGSSSGAIKIQGLVDWSSIINSSIVFNNSAEDGTEYYTFTVDLGVPTYRSVNFYVQLKTGAMSRAAYGRILRAWQEG